MTERNWEGGDRGRREKEGEGGREREEGRKEGGEERVREGVRGDKQQRFR